MNSIFTENVRICILFLSCNVKRPKQLPNFTEKYRTKRCSNRFAGCHLSRPRLYCYRSYRTLYMNQVPGKHTFGPWLNNSEVFFSHLFNSTQNYPIAGYNMMIKKGVDDHRTYLPTNVEDKSDIYNMTTVFLWMVRTMICALFLRKCEKGNIWEERSF